MTTDRYSSHALLSNIQCPVHGQIDLEDVTPDSRVIRQLIVSRPMQRLRRIKQLGFASLEYSGADHSRFSHAVGTMHVMRKILVSLRRKSAMRDLARDLKGSTGTSKGMERIAEQHMLVAALLQDCGELPYNVATSELIRPNADVFACVKEITGEDAQSWPSKPVFTIACLFALKPALGDMDVASLAYLMTGRFWSRQRPQLHPAMQLLDGVLDADRIDYVRRDAHHTGFGQVDVDAVIRSIETIDAHGPICSDPAPVASMLALRAHLYSTVYRSAANRFRVMMLRELLIGVSESDSFAELRLDVFGGKGFSVGYERFIGLDDVEIERLIASAHAGKSKNDLAPKALVALNVLSGAENNYRERWLSSAGAPEAVEPVPLPYLGFGEYFEDETYADQRMLRVRLSESTKSARLEQLNGPYAQITVDPRAQLPMSGDVLVFEPSHFTESDEYARARKQGVLGAGIRAGLVATDGIVQPSTLDDPEFSGPSVFISYCSEDISIVRAVVRELRLRKRKYYLIAGTFQGVGKSAAQNSIEAPGMTDACIMIVSLAYQARVTQQTQGPIAKELSAAREIQGKRIYPIVPLANAHYEALDKMPWAFLGFPENVPFMGPPLSARDAGSISMAIGEALKNIDDRYANSHAR